LQNSFITFHKCTGRGTFSPKREREPSPATRYTRKIEQELEETKALLAETTSELKKERETHQITIEENRKLHTENGRIRAGREQARIELQGFKSKVAANKEIKQPTLSGKKPGFF